MKKVCAITIIIAVLLSIVSCDTNRKYEAFNVDVYDLIDFIGDQKREIDLYPDDSWSKEASLIKEITFDGVTYSVEYDETDESAFEGYAKDIYFATTDDGAIVRIALNRTSGHVVSFTRGYNKKENDYFERDYTGGEQKYTEDECVAIVTEYLKKITDNASEYELVLVDHSFAQDFYIINFARYVGEYVTGDCVRFIISHKTGNIFTFNLYGDDSMKDAPPISDEEAQQIETKLAEKITEKYSHAENDYSYTYEVNSATYAKLRDGRYSIYYSGNVYLVSKADSKEYEEPFTIIVAWN